MSSTSTYDATYASATSNPHHQYDTAKAECSLTPYLAYAEPFDNGWTYKHLLEAVGGACGIACLILSSIIIFTHLIVWMRPNEQKQIVRIVFFAPVFVLFNFFSLWSYQYEYILTPFAELYECFALVAIFYLLVLYVSPDEVIRESFFHHLQNLDENPHFNSGSLVWFQTIWVAVFQILPAKLILSLLQWILNAAMCPLKYNDSKASTAISIVQSIVTAVCVMAIIRFEKRLKTEMRGHHPMAKMITFKGVVGIVLIQTPIFTALAQHQVFKPTKHISIVDFAIGTRCFLVCVEMFIVSLLFLWSFSAAEYRRIAKSKDIRKGGVCRALVDSLNISDIIRGCFYMIKIILGMGFGIQDQSAPAMMEDIEAPMNPPPQHQQPPHHQAGHP